MFKSLVYIAVLCLTAQQVKSAGPNEEDQADVTWTVSCKSYDSSSFPTTVCYESECTNAIRDHVKTELDASFTYLFMATYFDTTESIRPGLAKFLYESSVEEREHAIMFLDYLNMRGVDIPRASYEFKPTDGKFLGLVEEEKFLSKKSPAITYHETLKLALRMEIQVTAAIKSVIDKCAGDFHGADFLTDPVLEEQHEGMRKLQGAIKELDNMKQLTVGPFHEFLFDQKVFTEGL